MIPIVKIKRKDAPQSTSTGTWCNLCEHFPKLTLLSHERSAAHIKFVASLNCNALNVQRTKNQADMKVRVDQASNTAALSFAYARGTDECPGFILSTSIPQIVEACKRIDDLPYFKVRHG